jgi:hypothetical protein
MSRIRHRLFARACEPRGLSQSRLYLVRWYSLGKRPPSYSEMFLRAASMGCQDGLAARGYSSRPLSSGRDAGVSTTP